MWRHCTQISLVEESYMTMPAIGGIGVEDLPQGRRENRQKKNYIIVF